MGKLELLPNEQILATVKGDCWEAPGILGKGSRSLYIYRPSYYFRGMD